MLVAAVNTVLILFKWSFTSIWANRFLAKSLLSLQEGIDFTFVPLSSRPDTTFLSAFYSPFPAALTN